MTTIKTRATIATAFAALERAADENGLNANAFFRKAYDAALDGERGHRRMGAGLSRRYQQSAVTAARYFVVKWFLEPAKIASALDAASVRLDCLYASALRAELIGRMGADFTALRAKLELVLTIDYCDHISAP
jgi:hypothetical protein